MSETKKKRRSAKRKEWNAWLARAKKVRVDPLPLEDLPLHKRKNGEKKS